MKSAIARGAVALVLSLAASALSWGCGTRKSVDDAGTDAPAVETYDGGPGQAVTWTSNLSTFGERGRTVGSVIAFTCPADGFPGLVFGSGPYAGFSSVCTAAVHAGRVRRYEGGYTVIQVVPGMAQYTGSMGHEITSGNWTEDMVPPEPAFIFLSPPLTEE